MEKIPTAKEYFLKTVFPTSFENRNDEVELWFETNPDAKQSVDIMIEFAKRHVMAALKEASATDIVSGKSYKHRAEHDKNSILNSYPLEKIK